MVDETRILRVGVGLPPRNNPEAVAYEAEQPSGARSEIYCVGPGGCPSAPNEGDGPGSEPDRPSRP